MSETLIVKPDKVSEFDQLFSGIPCMRADFEFTVVDTPKEGTLRVMSELAGTFENERTNNAHEFEASADLFEPATH